MSETTEQRETEEREQTDLQHDESRFRTIVETTAEGVLIGRPDGVITYVNRQMADMLGYAPDDLVGRNGLELLFSDWRPRVMENRAALHAGQVLRGELKLRRKDGEAVWTHYSSSPLFDERQRHVANLNLHADITARVHAEEALRRQTDELREALDRARTAEEASMSAKRMLAEVNDAVSQWTQSVASPT